MCGPGLCGGIPVIAGRIVESAVATGPFWKVGESILIEESEIIVEEFGR